MTPTLGRIVLYRGKLGRQLWRPAIVVCTRWDLDPEGVEAGEIPDITGDNNVHLHVFTPSERGFFTEYDVAFGDEPGNWRWPLRV